MGVMLHLMTKINTQCHVTMNAHRTNGCRTTIDRNRHEKSLRELQEMFYVLEAELN